MLHKAEYNVNGLIAMLTKCSLNGRGVCLKQCTPVIYSDSENKTQNTMKLL